MSKPTIRVSEAEAASDLRSLLETVVSSHADLLQFDNETANLGCQSRVRWILRPGNDVFFIFSQGWLQDEPRGPSFRLTDTKIAGKVQYTFRF